jgi:hypothetical protein
MSTKIFESHAHLYQLWRDTCLGVKGSEEKEANFILDLFKSLGKPPKSIIDLGGGIGAHSKILSSKGFDVTLLDQSEKALQIVRDSYPAIKAIHSSFEGINLEENYDAGICMWSTLSYILDKNHQRNFYAQLNTHINNVIVLDQANFYRYSQSFSKTYEGEDEKYKMKILRNWNLNESNLKTTTYTYELFNKGTGKTEIIDDGESEQYLTVEELQNYLGNDWKLTHTFGDYSVDSVYEKGASLRLITVFERV